MNDIKIFVTHTPNRDSLQPACPCLYHVRAGSVFHTGTDVREMLRDDMGEHISDKNKSYCELTTQYWAWKNQKADYYGFCHYRRYFSFNPKKMRTADCGCLVYPNLSSQVQTKLGMEEQQIREYVKGYDFLIAQGIPMSALAADCVYDHYQKAPGLYRKDLDLMLTIMHEKYPQMDGSAKKYMRGRTFYPCNMFIMKAELFFEYAAMLFDILAEFDKRCDMARYSRESLRTPGHLGERVLGIFYTYIKQHGGCRVGEIQMALIEHTIPDARVHIKSEDAVIIVLAANQAYVPVLYTCIQSVIACACEQNRYEFKIFHTDILEDDMQIIRRLEKAYVHIEFVNVSSRIQGYRLKAKEHITSETYYRFLILDILKDCKKALYLDCDTIIRRDVARLFDTDLGDNLIGAVADPDFLGQCNGANADTAQYCRDVLKLKDPFCYFQAGVLLFHIAELKKAVTVEQLLHMAASGIYKYSDQDILNIVCEGRVTYLDMRWNMLTDNRKYRWQHVICYAPHALLDAYEQARKNPAVIHFAGDEKPWINPESDFALEFWRAARGTPYYERLLYQMCGSAHNKERRPSGVCLDILRRAAKRVLPKGSWIRRKAGGLYWKLK